MKRKLILYSATQGIDNKELDDVFLVMCGKPEKDICITYIPSQSKDSKKYYLEFQQYYQKMGISHFDIFFGDKASTEEQKEKLRKSDAIFLSGGNTFYFLHNLRENNLLPLLRDFVAKGGILIGASAGSILMTPDIHMSEIPSYDRDENIPGITDLTALSLVDFDFYPHYTGDTREEGELLNDSKNRQKTIYACKDGCGIAVHDDEVNAFGGVVVFRDGKKTYT